MNLLTFSLFLLLLTTHLSAKIVYTIDEETLHTAEVVYGKKAKERFINLVKLLNKIDKYTEHQKLKEINNFFNKVKYNTDMNVWHVRDYWATREEFLDKGEGDCEDYVIAKYFSLRQLSISENKIFLTYVKAIKYRESHMVLTYFTNRKAIPLVLDNINHKILPSTKRRDLRPLFSFNGEKIYMAKQRGLGRVVPQGKINLKQWSNLILKIKRENL